MPRVLRKSSESAREGEGRERVWTTRWKHRDAKGCSTGPSRAESEFCKTKRKGSQPSSPSRQILLASLALPPAGGGGGGPVSNHSLRLASFHSSPPLLSLFLPSRDRARFVLVLFSPSLPLPLSPPFLPLLRLVENQHGFLIGTIISVRSSSRKLIRIFYYETENS